VIRRHSLVLRRRLGLAAGCALLLASTVARAQFGGTTGTTGTGGAIGTASLDQSDFFIGFQAQQGSNLSDFAVQRFFNKANCDCSVPVFIYYTLLSSGFAKRPAVLAQPGNIEFWVGTSCDNLLLRNAQCKNLGVVTIQTFFQLGHQTLETDARTIGTYTTATGTIVNDGSISTVSSSGTFTPTPDCTAPVQQFTTNAYLLVDFNGDQTYEVVVTASVQVDLTPPAAPTNVVVEPGDEALSVSWTQVDSTLYPDLFGYQVLCQRGADLQVFKNGTFTPGFLTCPTTEVGTGPAALDEAFVCSPLLTALASSFRVKILQNGITYGATVVAVDNSGNASAPDVQFGVPAPTESFYNLYRQPPNGGAAAGGLCAVAPGPAPRGWRALPAAAAAGALAMAAAVARRRRRRR
jgi:MYXO-CTERM domain-containing protein